MTADLLEVLLRCQDQSTEAKYKSLANATAKVMWI
jgi:hypothetical protein